VNLSRAALAAVLSFVVAPACGSAEPAVSPEPAATPYVVKMPYIPDCSRSWGAAENIEVFIARKDMERALRLYAAAGKAQASCSRLDWRGNVLGHLMMMTAAANYNYAADLAATLRHYASARAYALSANSVYRQMLKTPGVGSNGLNKSTISAEMTANNDLIAKLKR
jgi:hypothetical protein